jgi:hypothetical protein
MAALTSENRVVTAAARLVAWHRTPDSRIARRITAGATLLFLFVICSWQPWQLFARDGFSSDFYDAQAHAFLSFQLDVPAGVAGPEGFLVDGATYLYFGPLLALARLPTALLGHWADGRLTRLSMVVAFFTACTATFHLAQHVRHLLGAGSTRRSTMLVAAVACSPALSLAGWSSVYHETELWAFALFLITCCAILRWHREPTTRWFGLAVVAAVCTMLTRSTVGFGALAALGLVSLLHWREQRAHVVRASIAVAGALALNSALNFAKFGLLLDLPAERQVATLQNPVQAAWFAGNNNSFFGLRFLPTTLVHYLRPDGIAFERLLPFVRFGPLAHEFGSYPLLGNTLASSLPSSATLLFVLAVFGLWVLVRRKAWVLVALLAGALIAALPSFLIGFVANRYLADMLPALVVPAAAALAVVRAPAWHPRLLRVGFAALVLGGLWVNVSLATWVQHLKSPTFTDIRYRVDEAVFGGAPPSVVTIVAGMPIPRDGVVGIDGACDGLYIAEQGHWVRLEAADGVRRLTGTVTGAGTAEVITPSGTIAIDVHSSDATVTYVAADGTASTGTAALTGGGTIHVEIISDPVLSQLEVHLDGRLALFTFAAPPLAEATVEGSVTVDPPAADSTPICQRLTQRSSSG